jgi:hypothetical protein
VNHSVAEVDLWENAGFQEDEKRKVVKELKTKYEDALREKFFGFWCRKQHRHGTDRTARAIRKSADVCA